MAEEEKTEHPKYPTDGNHIFGPWLSYDNQHVYRMCLHPECKYYESKKVT